MGRFFSLIRYLYHCLIKVLLFQNDDRSVLLTETAPLGDNDVLHTSETAAHNVRPIETTSSNPPQQVDTLGYEANLPAIDVTSEIGSAGSLFDQISEDFIQTPTQHASIPVPSCSQGVSFPDIGPLERPR
jgi:hypothetical protein